MQAPPQAVRLRGLADYEGVDMSTITHGTRTEAGGVATWHIAAPDALSAFGATTNIVQAPKWYHLMVRYHEEDGQWWGEFTNAPGVFVAGDTLDEVQSLAAERIRMMMGDS